MEIEKIKSVIEAVLFATGRVVKMKELVLLFELSQEDLETIIESMREEYKEEKRGIELIKVDDGYQLCTKKELYDFIYPVIDNRSKPNLSSAALETISIIAYNPRITRAEIDAIRGVSSDACIYKLLEYGFIEEAGKSDLPGKPMTYKTTNEFLKKFGYSSLSDLPELPRYKLDENKQIVIDELGEINQDENNQENTLENESNQDEKSNLDEAKKQSENNSADNNIEENE